MTAKCTKLLRSETHAEPHACPCPPALSVGHAGSGCGIYAFKDMDGMALEFPLWGMTTTKAPNMSEITVWGEVELWGHVYEHAKGYRSEFARIKSLTHVQGYGVSLEKLAEIGEIYGVPVEPINEDIAGVLARVRRRQDIINKLEPATVAWYILSSLYAVGKEELIAWVKERIKRGRNRKLA